MKEKNIISNRYIFLFINSFLGVHNKTNHLNLMALGDTCVIQVAGLMGK